MTEAALKQAENELNAAAGAVQRQFTLLEQAIFENPSKGDAFRAAQRVATALREEARKFQGMTEQLAGNIGVSAKNYMANSAAGSQAINAVAGMIDGGAGGGESFTRLTGGR
jgi:hypothetical protein